MFFMWPRYTYTTTHVGCLMTLLQPRVLCAEPRSLRLSRVTCYFLRKLRLMVFVREIKLRRRRNVLTHYIHFKGRYLNRDARMLR